MSPDLHFALSMILTYGCLLGFAIRELILLRRGNWRPDSAEETPAPLLPVDSASPQAGPAGKLPPTLMPLTRPSKTRVRERA